MNFASTFQVTLPSETEVQISRVFDAPARLVWDAYTRPELVRQWLLGPDGWDMPVCEIDLRVGGAYRYRWSHPDQGELGTGGAFTEVIPFTRIVSTEKMEGFDGEAYNVITLNEEGGHTTFTLLMRFDSQAARDGAVSTGMAEGIRASFDRLAGVLPSFAS